MHIFKEIKSVKYSVIVDKYFREFVGEYFMTIDFREIDLIIKISNFVEFLTYKVQFCFYRDDLTTLGQCARGIHYFSHLIDEGLEW